MDLLIRRLHTFAYLFQELFLFLNQVHAGHKPVLTGFLEIALVRVLVCVCVFVCVCVCARMHMCVCVVCLSVYP